MKKVFSFTILSLLITAPLCGMEEETNYLPTPPDSYCTRWKNLENHTEIEDELKERQKQVTNLIQKRLKPKGSNNNNNNDSNQSTPTSSEETLPFLESATQQLLEVSQEESSAE